MRRVIGWGLMAFAVWAPLPLGSNRPIFWVLNGCLAVLLAAAFLLGTVASRQKTALPAGAGWILCVLIMLPVWMAAQALLPAGSFANPWAESFAADLPRSLATLSVNPGASLATIVQVTTPILLAAMSVAIGSDPRFRHRLLSAIVIMTTAMGLYGFTALSLGFEQVPGGSDAYEGFLTGTQVNRNSAAILFGFGLICGFSLLPSRLASGGPEGRNHGSTFYAISTTIIRGGPILLAIAVNAAALLQTGSRAGTAATAVALIVVAVLLFGFGSRHQRAQRNAIIIAGVIIVAAAIGSASFVLDRITASELAAEARPALFHDTMAMVAERPLLGQGAGVFADLFPVFNSGKVPAFLVWNRAHSTYLQVAAELGLPALAVIILVALFVLIVLARGAIRRRTDTPAAIAALGALLAVMLHSVIDFSLQIQATGIVFAILAGAGYAEAQQSYSMDDSGPPHRGPEKPATPRISTYVEVSIQARPEAGGAGSA